MKGLPFRKFIFWTHLVSGLIAGVVIAIMSITGIAIAFEEEILHWLDRDVSHVAIPVDVERLNIEEMTERLSSERPDFPANYVSVPSSPDEAFAFYVGRKGPVYANPYSGELADTRQTAAHDFIHTLEEWHRFLGMKDDRLPIGKWITGVCNIAFLLLCVTGLYLWFPRKWSVRALKAILLFKFKAKGKARDYNWHNVLGIWSVPILVILAATAVVISFEWGHKLVFTLAGEEAPKSRNFGMMAVGPAAVPTPSAGAVALSYEAILSVVETEFPDYERIGLPLYDSNILLSEPAPIKLDVFLPDFMPSRGWIPVEVDPFSGEILQVVRFQDRSRGLQARVWTRFIHTGAAFGIVGKVIAVIATAASLVLVYTGFALSWRRFFMKRKRA
ncbi:MAG: PepSY-associated TM helix domain-containing protein [Opitutaceae bacterium]